MSEYFYKGAAVATMLASPLGGLGIANAETADLPPAAIQSDNGLNLYEGASATAAHNNDGDGVEPAVTEDAWGVNVNGFELGSKTEFEVVYAKCHEGRKAVVELPQSAIDPAVKVSCERKGAESNAPYTMHWSVPLGKVTPGSIKVVANALSSEAAIVVARGQNDTLSFVGNGEMDVVSGNDEKPAYGVRIPEKDGDKLVIRPQQQNSNLARVWGGIVRNS